MKVMMSTVLFVIQKAQSFCNVTCLLMDIQHALAITGPSEATVLKQSSRQHAAQAFQVKLLTTSDYYINNSQNKTLYKIKQV